MIKKDSNNKELPTVDCSIIIYKSERYFHDLFDSLAKLDYPKDKLTITIVNNYDDDGIEKIKKLYSQLSKRMQFFEFTSNSGFTGGHNRVIKSTSSDYVVIINPDSTFPPNLIKKLVSKAESDPRIGVVDVTQAPVDHPKVYDKKTGETPWCSGAIFLLRRTALNEAGAFDNKFFMYADDVDISWKMQLYGYKCIHLDDLIINHGVVNEGVSHKAGSFYEQYYSIRNGFLMRIIYGKWSDVFWYTKRVIKYLFSKEDYPGKKTKLKILMAMFDALRLLPHSLIRRIQTQKLMTPQNSKNIRFYGINYAEHRVNL